VSQNHEPREGEDFSPAHLELSRMMKRGRSWSGRERHCAYLNLGMDEEGTLPRFANISALSGIDFPEDGRALCLTDWDHDGDLDFWISNRTAPQLRFLRNDLASGHHFVALKLHSRKGNRDAIGARVEVRLAGGGKPLIKTLRAGDGYLAQSSKWLVFGLGAAKEKVELTVRWPGGAVEVVEKLSVDRHYLLAEGGQPEAWERPAGPLALKASVLKLAPESSRARVPMVTLLKVPAMDYESFEGKRQPVRGAEGRALLVNLWASWCAPCLEELREFKDRAGEMEEAGVDVLALALDGVGADGTDPAAAAKTAASLKLPFPTGKANEKILTILERLHVRLTPMELEVVVPMSILIDKEGRLAVFYKGAPSVDQLIADLSHSAKPRRERLLASTGLEGISLEAQHSSVVEAGDQLEVTQRFQFAQDMWQGRFLDDAVIQFLDTLALAPDFVEAVNNLGLVYATMGRHQQAIATYQRALAIRAETAMTYLNIGISLEAITRELEARTQYLRALEIDRTLAKANDALGLLHAKRGEFELARQYFAAETEVNPKFAEGHNHLGLIYLSLNQPQDAVAPLVRATKLNPKHADAHNNLGLALKRLGEIARAGDSFRAAVEAQPNYLPAILNLGLHHLEGGELRMAEKLFERALSLQPNSQLARRNLEKTRRLLER
jgi:tetratricopeptide (TPR) repeat protein